MFSKIIKKHLAPKASALCLCSAAKINSSHRGGKKFNEVAPQKPSCCHGQSNLPQRTNLRRTSKALG
jgi:hypothetical protein